MSEDKSEVAVIESATEVARVTTPATLVEMAVKQGADLEYIKELMELQRTWEEGEAKKAFTIAMTAFRATCPTIDKDKKGHNSNYASLAHTLKLIKQHLSDHGLSHSWKTGQDENGQIVVTCHVTHKLGYQESTSLRASPDGSGSKNNIQAMGSTISYLERYTLYAILGLASAEQDDDAQTAIEYVTEEQAANIQALFEEVKGNKKAFLKNFKCESFDAIPASEHDRAIKLLESKRGQQ